MNFMPTDPQCYEKYDFGSFQKGGHGESRTLHSLKLQVTRAYFTNIPTFSVSGLDEIRAIKFWAFFEILILDRKFDSDCVLYIQISNSTSQYFQK